MGPIGWTEMVVIFFVALVVFRARRSSLILLRLLQRDYVSSRRLQMG